MLGKHIGMWIDEDKTMLNISDHNLVRAWFKIRSENYKIPKKKPVRKITWISRKPDRIQMCVENFKTKIGKKHSFRKCMDKLRLSVNHTMKRSLKKKPGGKKHSTMRAAPWVDKELLDNIGLRSRYSREWRYARKKGEPDEIVELCKNRYLQQKSKTATLTGDKKSNWEEKRIAETWGDARAF